MKDTLFAKKNDLEYVKGLEPEEDLFTANDMAELDDDIDDDMTLVELARRSMSQARSSNPLKSIRSAANEGDLDIDDLEQADLLKVGCHVHVVTIFVMCCK